MISAKQNLVGKISAKQSLKGNLNNAIVYPELEDLTVVPSKEQQEFNHPSSYGYDNVTVSGDENLLPENIKKDVSIFGVNGNLSPQKYKPQFISFYGFNGDTLDNELSDLDTSKVTDMRAMFGYCSNLTSLDLSSLDTSKVTDMNAMFIACNSLISLSKINAESVNNVVNFIRFIEKLERIWWFNKFRQSLH